MPRAGPWSSGPLARLKVERTCGASLSARVALESLERHLRRVQVLHAEPDQLADRDLVLAGAARRDASRHFTELAGDPAGVDGAAPKGPGHVTELGRQAAAVHHDSVGGRQTVGRKLT